MSCVILPDIFASAGVKTRATMIWQLNYLLPQITTPISLKQEEVIDQLMCIFVNS